MIIDDVMYWIDCVNRPVKNTPIYGLCHGCHVSNILIYNVKKVLCSTCSNLSS